MPEILSHIFHLRVVLESVSAATYSTGILSMEPNVGKITKRFCVDT